MNDNRSTLMKCPFYQREGGKQTIQCDSKAVMDGTAKCVHCFRSNARRDRFEQKHCMDVKGWETCPWAQVIVAKLQ